MSKQTAVEWLVDQYINGNYSPDVYNKALEMEKQQQCPKCDNCNRLRLENIKYQLEVLEAKLKKKKETLEKPLRNDNMLVEQKQTLENPLLYPNNIHVLQETARRLLKAAGIGIALEEIRRDIKYLQESLNLLKS